MRRKGFGEMNHVPINSPATGKEGESSLRPKVFLGCWRKEVHGSGGRKKCFKVVRSQRWKKAQRGGRSRVRTAAGAAAPKSLTVLASLAR